MKKLVLSLFGLFAAGIILAQDLTIEQVLDKYYNAVGQDKLSKVQSTKMTGKGFQMGMEFPLTVIRKRPNMSYTEVEVQGMKIISAFDGEKGWAIVPFTSPDPQDLPEEQVKSAKEQGIDGMLFDWKNNGRKVELVGKEDMDGTPVYNIKVTTKDNNVYNYFLDANNFLILKTKTSVLAQGQTVDAETVFSDYRDVNGIKMPFKMSQSANGQPGIEMTYDTIQFDVPVDNAIFAKPAAGGQN